MTLTQEQVRHFREHGYLALSEFWTAREIEAMRVELDHLKQKGLLRNVHTEGDGKTHSKEKQNLQLCPMSPHSALYRAMPFAPKLIEAVSQLLDDPVLFHLDQVFIKPGRHGVGTNWHQDNAYFHMADPLKGTAAWTAVHDATVENGTLNVIPDAYNTEFKHTRDGESDHHIRCYPPEEKAIAIEVPAGGIIFFAYGTPHCTRANNTDKERAGVALHFHNGNYPAQAGLPQEKRIVLTGPNATGGKREYGIDLTGAWEKEVASTLAGAAAKN